MRYFIPSFLAALFLGLGTLSAQNLPTNAWVCDTCLAVPQQRENPSGDMLIPLKQVTAVDNVHLTVAGYRNVAVNIGSILDSIHRGKIGKFTPSPANPLSVSGSRRFHWRGFNSPVGSKSSPSGAGYLKSARGRAPKPGPYHKSGSSRSRN